MSADKQRIIELQRSLRIARLALEEIKHTSCDAHGIADNALDEMMPLERKAPLQGLVGHEQREKRP
jgi:hypothetical protein